MGSRAAHNRTEISPEARRFLTIVEAVARMQAPAFSGFEPPTGGQHLRILYNGNKKSALCYRRVEKNSDLNSVRDRTRAFTVVSILVWRQRDLGLGRGRKRRYRLPRRQHGSRSLAVLPVRFSFLSGNLLTVMTALLSMLIKMVRVVEQVRSSAKLSPPAARAIHHRGP